MKWLPLALVTVRFNKNAKANLTGKGFGFLYLQNSAIGSDKKIVIGKGIDYSFWEQSGNKNTLGKFIIIKKTC
jgi:hypothetical protein